MPDAVEVEVDDSGRRTRLDVHVAADDMGRVIGRRGRVANAIRTVVRAAADRDDVDVEVEFVD
ncbi:MAG: KH domain-containing protein [Acidimicrobiia bacterium]|nr:KH domain-containing protein [Acidimicrobiia bacterium]